MNVHYSSYNDNLEFINELKSSELIEPNTNTSIIEAVYNEGNSDLNPNICIIDCACPSSVVGRKVFDAIVESRNANGNLIKRRKEN